MPKGGIFKAKDVMGYKPPQGPTNVSDTHGPGLHGDTHHCGSQGEYGTDCETSGSPGIGGDRKKAGTQK